MLTLALPKGKLGQESLALLAKIGWPGAGIDPDARALVHEFPEANKKYIFCRPTDVPTLVEYGAADVGMVGKDTLLEASANVYELVDLQFGYCRLVLAVPAAFLGREELACPERIDLLSFCQRWGQFRVATKFPRLAQAFFREQGIPAEVIKLHGNIELAPRVGLAQGIVDLVATGKTLRDNHLIAVRTIHESTARLIVNRVSYRLKYHQVQELVEALKKALAAAGARDGALGGSA